MNVLICNGAHAWIWFSGFNKDLFWQTRWSALNVTETWNWKKETVVISMVSFGKWRAEIIVFYFDKPYYGYW